MKAFALVGIDGEVFLVDESREKLEEYQANSVFPSFAESIVEFEYNDEPITERGLELQEKLKVLLKDVRKIHMNRQVGYYELHVDDRLQLVYDLLTTPREPFSFNDSHAPKSKQPKLDVERYAKSLDKELETYGIS